MIDWQKIVGFDWDVGNVNKNEAHQVSMVEAEQVFFNEPLIILEDVKHSGLEYRLHALGITTDGRKLHITFTLRSGSTKIRVISARDMHKRERLIYEAT